MEDLDSVWIKTKEYSCRWIYMESVDNNTFLVSRALKMKNPTTQCDQDLDKFGPQLTPCGIQNWCGIYTIYILQNPTNQ